MRKRVVVLASGSGSNLQAVLDACDTDAIDADVVGVVSDRVGAHALVRADRAGVHAELVRVIDGEQRADYDTRLAGVVGALDPDWVVLAGWMRLLTMNFLGRFPQRVVNLHPALPGQLPGIRAIERAWEQAVSGERASSGVMVHLVPDEGVDDGPVLGVREIPIDTSGTLDEFADTVHSVEHDLLVETLSTLCSDERTRPIDHTHPTEHETLSDEPRKS